MLYPLRSPVHEIQHFIILLPFPPLPPSQTLYFLDGALAPSLLLLVAISYFLFVLSLNAFSVGYNYLDYRFSWSPLEISYFFATYNVFMGLAGGLCIRWIVPRYLSEEYGVLFGITVQVCRFHRRGE